MAKQRKQKQKDASRAPTLTADSQRPNGSCCATVRSQKLCVAVDLAQQRIYGYTELTVVAPTNGVIGLHARGLHIEQVLVDGISAPFELRQQSRKQQHFQKWGYAVSSSADAADAFYPRYVAALDEELVPELLIRPGEATTPIDPSQDPASSPKAVVEASKENGGAQSATSVETKSANVGSAPPVAPAEERRNVVRVEYWVEKPVAGAHFKDKVFHTNNQLRRARCWFPCVDSTSERCSFYLEITVASEYMAVSNGNLLYQVYGKEGSQAVKTYAYNMSIPITANYISLVVAPLVVLPDRSNAMISHMCMPGDASKLQCTVTFFHLLFSTYEEYLGAPFPFGSYKQVFVDSESSISSASFGASMVTLSSHLLVDERIIDQAFVTQLKLAQALAQQWFGVFITPETPADAWLLEGLAGFLCDQFVKRYMGNNEARYRRFRANEAVCMVDADGAPVLSWPAVAGSDLYGTETLGALGQVRAWKATAVVQMLEKQMGPEPFKKILQRIIVRALDPVRHLRRLSTKEFRHFANKLGNLERPYLKEFFPRWVESSGCPRIRMGFLYSKRRNMVELAVHREAAATSDRPAADKLNVSKPVMSDLGWPGMMSIRIHELDGMYDHPSLPMAGDTYQLLDIQCHSKLAGRRITKPKKGSKPDGADDNMDAGAADVRPSLESPVLWLRADPQMEYIAEIHLSQPEQMWINQLEKDRDVVGQLQAIAAMVALPRSSFAIATALNNSLTDSKVFCRVRIEAAYALGSTATEANSWVGLSHLIKFYKSCRCDPEIGLPKSNDFHNLAEYLVLEAVPGAIAAVRGSDGKSPVEATDFILHILKHNDNSGNRYSDVFWLASVIESIGGFEFGQQNVQTLSKFLKQIDRLVQYDRLMPSYNGVLTISCIQTLTRLAVKFSHILPSEPVKQFFGLLGDAQSTPQRIRATSLQSLLEVEARSEGLDSAVKLALHLVEMDPSLMVQSKLMEHMVYVSSLKGQPTTALRSQTLEALLEKLDSISSFSNVLLRHHLFSLVQVLAGRCASLYRREDTVALQLAAQQKTPQSKEPQKEGNAKSTVLLKGKIQQPHTEPIRIRFVPVRPNVAPKVEHLAVSASSHGKEPTKETLRVGKVKLRLKRSSFSGGGASPMELSAGSLEKGIIAASQSPLSVQVSAKADQTAEESAQSRPGMQEGTGIGQHVKEEIGTPVVAKDGEIESADDHALMWEESGSIMPKPEEPTRFGYEVGDGFGMDSQMDRPVDVLNVSNDKDGTENLSQISQRPKSMRREKGVSPSNRSKVQENSLPEVHGDTGAGPSDPSDTKPVTDLSASNVSEGKSLTQKEKKDKKDMKHKKAKKRHHKEKEGDSLSQGKKRTKENDIEYRERKRRRREEKDKIKLQKLGRTSLKVDVSKNKPVKAQEIDTPATVPETAAVHAVVKAEGDPGIKTKADVDPGRKIRLKLKKNPITPI